MYVMYYYRVLGIWHIRRDRSHFQYNTAFKLSNYLHIYID